MALLLAALTPSAASLPLAILVTLSFLIAIAIFVLLPHVEEQNHSQQTLALPAFSPRVQLRYKGAEAPVCATEVRKAVDAISGADALLLSWLADCNRFSFGSHVSVEVPFAMIA